MFSPGRDTAGRRRPGASQELGDIRWQALTLLILNVAEVDGREVPGTYGYPAEILGQPRAGGLSEILGQTDWGAPGVIPPEPSSFVQIPKILDAPPSRALVELLNYLWYTG
mgnify:CR=1 FL=1